MNWAVAWVLALGLLALGPRPAAAEPHARPGSARELLQGCLKTPSREAATQLASAAGARPYSEIRRRRELKTSTANYEQPASSEDQRTTTKVTEFRGWDLPGPGAGSVEYREETTEIVWVDRATRQAVTPVRASRSRSCRLQAPVFNARTIFELYEDLTDRRYGIRIAADRQWINVFMFDPDRFDVELIFELDKPIAGLTPDATSEGRLALSDGGPRVINGVSPGIPVVSLTRAALLAGLDQPATMTFFNMEIEPIVQRLSER
jgi:hypothetical protein